MKTLSKRIVFIVLIILCSTSISLADVISFMDFQHTSLINRYGYEDFTGGHGMRSRLTQRVPMWNIESLAVNLAFTAFLIVLIIVTIRMILDVKNKKENESKYKTVKRIIIALYGIFAISLITGAIIVNSNPDTGKAKLTPIGILYTNDVFFSLCKPNSTLEETKELINQVNKNNEDEIYIPITIHFYNFDSDGITTSPQITRITKPSIKAERYDTNMLEPDGYYYTAVESFDESGAISHLAIYKQNGKIEFKDRERLYN